MEVYIDIMFMGLLIIVAIVDIYEHRIPNSLCIGIFMLGIFSELVTEQLDFNERIVGAFVISLPLFVIDLFVSGSIGGGDIKFMAVNGFMLGYKIILKSAVFGFLAAGIWAIGAVASRKKKVKDYLPMGPCFCVGILVNFLIECNTIKLLLK